MTLKNNLLEQIEQTEDERTLLTLAYTCEGNIKSGQMTPDDYAQCMVKLAEKLGFGITSESLKEAAAKYIS